MKTPTSRIIDIKMIFQTTLLRPLFLVTCVCFVLSCEQKGHDHKLQVEVDYGGQTSGFEHPWCITGFTPGEQLLSDDMQMAMDLIGACSNQGIKYIRPHDLLDLVTMKEDNEGSWLYDWTLLDSAVDVLVNNDLKLYFELMGIPKTISSQSNTPFFNDFEDEVKLVEWKRFVEILAGHLMDRYGKEEVETWYFEGTNEPDLDVFWPYGLNAYYNYYDACSEGLLSANPDLKFGGPGNAFMLSDVFKGLLQHCDTGTNYFTKEKGVRLDFITVHIKRQPDEMLRMENEVMAYIRMNHPKFADVPFGNDEADPTYGWGEAVWWRPTAWYSSFIAKSAHLHVKNMVDNALNYIVLSNDNAFRGDWYQRTLFAEFKDKEKPQGTSLVKKNTCATMSLLGLLGTEYIDVDLPADRGNLGVFATKRKGGNLVSMAYNMPEIPIRINEVLVKTLDDSTSRVLHQLDTNIVLDFSGIPFKEPLVVVYKIDRDHTNPFESWKSFGEPDLPSLRQLSLLQNEQEPTVEVLDLGAFSGGNISLPLDLPHAAIATIVIGENPTIPPKKIQNLRVKKYRGVDGHQENVLRWDHLINNGFLSYEIFCSRQEKENFVKIHESNLIDAGFVHRVPANPLPLRYKVRAQYINGMKGAFSEDVFVE